MHYSMKVNNVCSSKVDFDLIDGKVYNVAFTGGCNGNLKAIGKLVEGMESEKVVCILKGNTCGASSTSCADQFALAIEKAVQA